MWNFLSPIALFASAKAAGGKSNELVPVAIQMDYKPGLVILRPLSTLENDLVISRINFIFTKYLKTNHYDRRVRKGLLNSFNFNGYTLGILFTNSTVRTTDLQYSTIDITTGKCCSVAFI